MDEEMRIKMFVGICNPDLRGFIAMLSALEGVES